MGTAKLKPNLLNQRSQRRKCNPYSHCWLGKWQILLLVSRRPSMYLGDVCIFSFLTPFKERMKDMERLFFKQTQPRMSVFLFYIEAWRDRFLSLLPLSILTFLLVHLILCFLQVFLLQVLAGIWFKFYFISNYTVPIFISRKHVKILSVTSSSPLFNASLVRERDVIPPAASPRDPMVVVLFNPTGIIFQLFSWIIS